MSATQQTPDFDNERGRAEQASAVREREITDEVQMLAKAAAQLMDVTTALTSRLEPLMSADTPREAPDTVPPDSLTSLGGSLRMTRIHLIGIGDRLMRLMDRLEV